jgi:hypothetical protein
VSEFSSSKRVLEAEILSLAAWVGHRRVQASKSSSSVDFHMLLLNGGFFLQIIRAVVENNLNASFVTIGLLASVPDLNQRIPIFCALMSQGYPGYNVYLKVTGRHLRGA